MYYITASLVCIISLLLLYLVTYHKNEVGYQRLNQLVEEDDSGAVDEQEVVDPIHTQKKFVPFTVLWGKLNLIVMTIFLRLE